jgi:hypothetical protein
MLFYKLLGIHVILQIVIFLLSNNYLCIHVILQIVTFVLNNNYLCIHVSYTL